jgi:hypothetical protein
MRVKFTAYLYVEEDGSVSDLSQLQKVLVAFLRRRLQIQFEDSIKDAVETIGERIFAVLHDLGDGKDDNDDKSISLWPPKKCLDSRMWLDTIDFLGNRILWDRDWAMEDQISWCHSKSWLAILNMYDYIPLEKWGYGVQ